MSGYGRGPPKIDGMTSLKVDNLTYRTSPDELRRVFDKYGDIGDVYIPRDRFSRESRGFAFIRYYEKRDAEDAIDALDGYVLDGRELRVQIASHKRPTEPFRSRGPPRGGRDDRDRRRRSRSRSRSRGRRGSRRSRSRSRSNSRKRSRSGSRGKSSRDRRTRRGSKSSSRSRSKDRASEPRERSGSKSPERNNNDDEPAADEQRESSRSPQPRSSPPRTPSPE